MALQPGLGSRLHSAPEPGTWVEYSGWWRTTWRDGMRGQVIRAGSERAWIAWSDGSRGHAIFSNLRIVHMTPSLHSTWPPT